MSETVPLESVSRWSGLSPWVALLPWRMAGAASRNQVRGGLCVRPCAGQAPGIKSGAGSVVHRGTGPAPDRSRGEDLCDACGVGGRGMEARRGSGRRRQRPPCGVLPGGTERPFKQAQEGGDPGSKQGTEAPRLPSRVVNRCLRYDSARPLSGQGRGQAFAKGLSPRRLRPETTLPGRQRIPRTAATSSVPPSPVGTSAAALPVPWL